jgi:cytochrome c oxidase subunit 3
VDIIRSLTEKSWLTVDSAGPEDSAREDETVVSAAPTGLRVYFAVATVLFLILGAAYLMRMGMGQATSIDWRPTPKPWLLWLNSAFLIFSSLVFQRARIAAHRGQMDRVSSSLLTAGLLAFAFLVGQLTVWRQFAGSGYYLASNPANAFFYLITTLHGLHLLGGLVAWGRTTVKALNGEEATEISRSVDLCAVYWHFLLVVWLAFFYLLLTT